MKSNSILVIAFIPFMFLVSCKKYLDAKPDKTLVIPSTIADLQAMLDYDNFLNSGNGVSFGEASADNYYLPTEVFNAQNNENRNTYIWNNSNYNNYPNDWSAIYNVINVANIALEVIDKIPNIAIDRNDWNNVKGSALFFRASSLLKGAFTFCKAYDAETATSDLGMAIKSTSDPGSPITRSNLQETYDQIIDDIKKSIPLLPDLPIHVQRPAKSSGYALLARVYLSMRIYDSCVKYANLSLEVKNDLIDYNTVNTNLTYPFQRFNKEILFNDVDGGAGYYIVSPYYAIVDTTLYNSYDENDIRKTAFFISQSPGVRFQGMYYDQSRRLFIGLATDEVYLMRAECYARSGDTEAALNDLNYLMVNRWKSGSFIPIIASDAAEALSIILTERRKELIFRNVRWMDIKRLNKEGANITLKRVVNGQTYILSPNDNKFALALPADIIRMTGMPQNPL